MILLYVPNMPAKPVQISLDPNLLSRIDRDPEAKKLGRSAFIRNAIAAYLRDKDRRQIDEAIRASYDGAADDMLDDIAPMIGGQAWPES
jgi:metal-responsive CopG/Arc/MetJ family transcriptional regulator